MALVGAVAKGLGLVDKKKAAPAAPAAEPTDNREAQMAAEQASALRARQRGRGMRSLLSPERQDGLKTKLGGMQ